MHTAKLLHVGDDTLKGDFVSAPIFGPGALRQHDRLAEKAKANASFYAAAGVRAPADVEATRQVSRRYARKIEKARLAAEKKATIATRRQRRAA